MCKRTAYLVSCVFILSVAADTTSGDLVAYYPLNEGAGTVIRDFSGFRHAGIAQAEPTWIDSMPGFGTALYFDGSDPAPAWVNCGTWNPSADTGQLTVACWVRWDGHTNDWQGIVAKRDAWDPEPDGSMMWHLEINATNGFLNFGSRAGYIGVFDAVPEGEWTHVAATFDKILARLYADGEEKTDGAFSFGLNPNATVMIGADNLDGSNAFHGAIDEVRIYNTALTPEEIQTTMVQTDIKPELAIAPSPKDNAVEVPRKTILSWLPGIYAETHNVYFGTDFNDVNEATPDDPRGVLINDNQTETSYDVGILDYNEVFYWRVDEVNAAPDNTIYKGGVWSFQILNFLVIDDIESYDDIEPNRIFDRWDDGFYDNDNGSQVGYKNPTFVETSIVRTGEQSMPLLYDNQMKIAEAYLPLSGSASDWTQDSVDTLSLWFRGNQEYLGDFTESNGTITIKGAGADIFDNSDQFHFAYKEMTGQVEIIARVVSLENTDPFAKAGVMVRDTLEANARNVGVLLTPENGIRYQFRKQTDGATEREFDPNQTEPYWVRIVRTASGLVRAYQSEDGSNWTQFGLQVVQMNSPWYVGLAVTSHNEGVATEAVFSNVTITGNGSEQPWMDQDVGLLSNSPDRIFVALNDSDAVYYESADPNAPSATVMDTWTEWRIPLQTFADLGVDLGAVNKMTVGVGTQGDDSSDGGEGRLYFDDFRLYRP